MGKLIERPTKVPPVAPLLHEGDRLSGKEFLRRYEADPVVTRAELIDGVVYVNAVRRPDGTGESVSPISATFHADPHGVAMALLGMYALHTPGVAGTGPVTILVNDRNLPEPDAVMRVLPECGGSTTLNARRYIVGPPELLVEVAHTSVARDMGPKYRAYEAGGVAEYLVWRTSRGKIDMFALRRGAYSAVTPDAAGVVRSGQFPGLWFDFTALLAGDNSRSLETLQAGLASPEHAAFVAKLAARAKRKRK